MNTVAFKTLGCKLNFAETSTISRLFLDNDFEKKEFNEPADVYIINTCSVTQLANKKSRNAINRALKLNPTAYIIVTGCYAQLKPEEINTIPGVDLIIGASDKYRISEFIENFKKQEHATIISSSYKEMNVFFPAYSYGDRTRSFLKVQDGCDYFCSYCTIPLARGKSRNQSIEECIKQANIIANSGVKEIILSGINIGDFGKSTDEKLIDLLIELNKIKGIERYRISSIEPNLLTEEIIDFVIESDKFMPHFHIPLQSGSDSMLKIMGRRYNTNLFKSRVDYIKSKSPNAFIGIDLIVGVHGETDELFMESINFVKSLNISAVHVFTYSERENTKAINAEGVVQNSKRKDRSILFHNLSDSSLIKFYKKNIDTEAKVLFETFDKGILYGHTENYIKVQVVSDVDLVNSIKPIKLISLGRDKTMRCEFI